MNISLPEELKEYVEEQAKGGYSTPSEFVRDLIRQDRKRRANDRLEQLLLEGLDSGEPIPVGNTFWNKLRDNALAQIADRKTPQHARKRQR